MSHPLRVLERWLREARDAGLPQPQAMTLATSGLDGRPSARVVSLKRIESDSLLFTTGLRTRKARELATNPSVAAVFYWPAQGRQISIEGVASAAERVVSEALSAERPLGHQLQTLPRVRGRRS